MNEVEREEILDRWNAASPGAWNWRPWECTPGKGLFADDKYLGLSSAQDCLGDEDLDFIANSRKDIEALLVDVEQKLDHIAELEEQIRELNKQLGQKALEAVNNVENRATYWKERCEWAEKRLKAAEAVCFAVGNSLSFKRQIEAMADAGASEFHETILEQYAEELTRLEDVGFEKYGEWQELKEKKS